MNAGNKLELRRVVIRGLELTAEIGVYPHERGSSQKVRIDAELEIECLPIADELSATVSYDGVVEWIRSILGKGHTDLAETLAERIADRCLEDPRVERAKVRVEKPQAIIEATGVGAEVVKSRRRTAKP